MYQIQEFRFYLECNADPLKGFKREGEKFGMCFRNLIFLVLCIGRDKGPGGGQGDQRGNRYRDLGDRGMLLSDLGAPALC